MQKIATRILQISKALLNEHCYVHFGRESIDLGRQVGYAYRTLAGYLPSSGDIVMQWTAPAFEEVCLNCEINSYASAKL